MRAKQRNRLLAVAALVIGVGAAVALALKAFNENLMYYYSPSEVVAGKAPADSAFRLGGMVVDGSLQRDPDSLKVQFALTDYQEQVTVDYEGILPDLFREGQGIVAFGRLGSQGRFVAHEVLAKHDENYMPPEVADSLKKGREGADSASSSQDLTPSRQNLTPSPQPLSTRVPDSVLPPPSLGASPKGEGLKSESPEGEGNKGESSGGEGTNREQGVAQ